MHQAHAGHAWCRSKTRNRDGILPRADLADVLAWEQLRHAVEDAVGAAVRAHPQRRWSSPATRRPPAALGEQGARPSATYASARGYQWRTSHEWMTGGGAARQRGGGQAATRLGFGAGSGRAGAESPVADRRTAELASSGLGESRVACWACAGLKIFLALGMARAIPRHNRRSAPARLSKKRLYIQ